MHEFVRLILSNGLSNEAIKRKEKEEKKINASACALGLPSPDDCIVDLSLHGRGRNRFGCRWMKFWPRIC